MPKRGYRFVAPVAELRNLSGEPRFNQHEGRTAPAEDNSKSGRPRIVYWPGGAVAIAIVLIAAAIAHSFLQPASRHTAETPADPTHKQVTFTGREGAPTLSPDGERIAYVSNDSPRKKLMVQELSGGSPLTIFSAQEVGHLRWSPDGSDLIVWARGGGHNGVYIVPQMGGTPRLIAQGMYIGCWSPDGSTIAVAGVPGKTCGSSIGRALVCERFPCRPSPGRFGISTGRRRPRCSRLPVAIPRGDLPSGPLAGMDRNGYKSSPNKRRSIRHDGRPLET